jgi:DNA-binding NtrC family response regulator
VHGIVGESPAIWEVRRQIELAASRKAHVLVVGQSGTGKELVAHAVHARSDRSRRPLVARNAATFPETLIDAELFGNAKDYPNPGMADRPGLLGLAHGTTLFLDEIAEMPITLQPHLLRVLDAGEYQRLGDRELRKADFRLVAATNRPELLRADLAARFATRIEIPGLDERREDIPLLAHHLLRRMAAENPSTVRHFCPAGTAQDDPMLPIDLVEALVRRSFSTHLRELKRILWNIVDGVPADKWNLGDVRGVAADSSPPAISRRGSSLPTTDRPPMQAPSREIVQRALEDHNWVVDHTWRPLGLRSRHALNRLISRFGIERPRQGRGANDREGNL